MQSKRILIIFFFLAIIIAGGFSIYSGLKPSSNKALEKTSMPINLTGKKIAMIIAFKDFRDEEYFVPKGVFENYGAEVKTVSTKEGTAIGADGGEVNVDILLDNLKPPEFDAVVFIGGPGAVKYLDNESSYRVARETVKENKILGAICVAPTILAKAGVLEGKKATVWSSPMDRGPVRTLQDHGAEYQDLPVVTDARIITGDGPSAAKQFAEEISKLLIK